MKLLNYRPLFSRNVRKLRAERGKWEAANIKNLKSIKNYSRHYNICLNYLITQRKQNAY